jgi:hypothetical protein
MSPRGRSWPVPAALVALSAIPLTAGTLRLIQLAGGPAIIPADHRFAGFPIALVMHILGAAVFALAGMLQFVPRFRRRHPGLHRGVRRRDLRHRCARRRSRQGCRLGDQPRGRRVGPPPPLRTFPPSSARWSTLMITTYAIRVEGHLDDHWSAWLGGLDLTRDDDGATTVTVEVADQAQLHGVLAGLRDMGAVIFELRTRDATSRAALERQRHTERQNPLVAPAR